MLEILEPILPRPESFSDEDWFFKPLVLLVGLCDSEEPTEPKILFIN